MSLQFDIHSGRFMIGERELHCGDCFQVKLGEWMDVRIEHCSEGWYLIGPGRTIPQNSLPGLEARLYDH